MLEADTAAKASIRAQGQRVTSAITVAEASRAILRARLLGRITVQQQRAALLTLQRFTRRSHIVSVTETILSRVGRPFPVEPIRTLDAIHLATAEAFAKPETLRGSPEPRASYDLFRKREAFPSRDSNGADYS
jgi:predicted nucleic acid-binding protein